VNFEYFFLKKINKNKGKIDGPSTHHMFFCAVLLLNSGHLKILRNRIDIVTYTLFHPS